VSGCWGGAAGEIESRKEAEDLVGAARDEVEPVEGKGRSCTVADEPLEAGAVGGLDADVGVQAEAATVIPGQHVLCLVGLQKALAPKVRQHPFSHRVLEVLPDNPVQGGGLGALSAIELGMRAGGWPRCWCGPTGFPVCGAGLYCHRSFPASRGVVRWVSTSKTADGWGRGMGEVAGCD